MPTSLWKEVTVAKTINHGLCYILSEYLYHVLGGKASGWTPMVLRLSKADSRKYRTHWFIKHKSGLIIDPTANQFVRPVDYSKARGKGFLTKGCSKKTLRYMEVEYGIHVVVPPTKPFRALPSPYDLGAISQLSLLGPTARRTLF